MKTKDLFSQWSQMVISLNIWHFMRHTGIIFLSNRANVEYVFLTIQQICKSIMITSG